VAEATEQERDTGEGVKRGEDVTGKNLTMAGPSPFEEVRPEWVLVPVNDGGNGGEESQKAFWCSVEVQKNCGWVSVEFREMWGWQQWKEGKWARNGEMQGWQ